MKGARKSIIDAEKRFLEGVKFKGEEKKYKKRRRHKKRKKKKKLFCGGKKRLSRAVREQLVAKVEFVKVEDLYFISGSALQA